MKTTQEILELIESIPEDRFIVNYFVDRENKKCCSLGHINRLTSSTPELYSDNCVYGVGTELTYTSILEKSRIFLRKKYKSIHDIVNINDSLTSYYPQTTPKQRVVALLKDMIKEGY